jgi:hypothetical protein
MTKRGSKMTNWREINEQVELRDRKLEQTILRDIGATRALRKLVRGGADRTAVMRLLVSSVHHRESWQKPARRLKKQLESLANQLETVASHAERVHQEYLSHAAVMVLILHLFSGQFGKKDPVWDDIWKRANSAKGSSAKILFGFVRLYAKNCRAKATHLGKLLREFPPRQRCRPLDALMFAVWHGTKRYYDREVAYLLTKAFRASGETNEFGEDQIKKHRQRHVLPRIQQYLERCASPSTVPETKERNS